MERAALEAIQLAELRLADADRVLEHGLEHGLKLAWRRTDDLQDIGRRRLLLQRLPQFAKEPRVLDRDHRLGGEVLYQRNLLVGERPHFFAVHCEGADQLVLLQHRDDECSAYMAQFNRIDDAPIPLLDIAFMQRKIGDVDHRLGRGHLTEGRHRFGPISARNPARCRKGERGIVRGNVVKKLAVPAEYVSGLGVADSCRIFQHSGEYRLEVAGRAGNDAQDLRRRRLLLQ